ncbi:PAS domain S-box protein [delta proteobacterium NaphS2]|nr:PAS domain S-box protein [delta proteobacterium NaphS2]
METHGPNSTNFADLRKRAEAFLEENPNVADASFPSDVRDLVEELRVHQIELEMQGDELRNTCGELDQAKAIFEDLYDFAPVGYITLDEYHLISRVNFLAARLLNKPRGSLLGLPFSNFLVPGDMGLFYRHFEKCIESGKQETCELRLKPAGSARSLCHIQLESRAIADTGGKYNRIRAALIDVTRRKLDEERIRSLGQELLISQEKERQMIACELHDRVAQDLSAVKLGCDSFLQDYPEIPREMKDKASKLSSGLKAVITAVRDLSYELRPPDLDHATPDEVIARLCKEFSNTTGIETDFFSTGMERLILDLFSITNIYRMVQEGLVNIQKHAAASHVHVALSYSHPCVIIRITDNGKGFDVEKRVSASTAEKHMGLRSMEERSRLLGGTFNVKSHPMHGTEILIQVPYGRKNHD